MSENLFNTPLWIVGPVVVLSFCGMALLGLNLTRRFVTSRLRISHEDSEFTGTMVQSVMVFYGLAVALIAVSVWETHSSVADTVSLEASRLAGLYRDTGSYPEPLRSELHGELSAYLDVVVNQEWPAQRRGEHPTGGLEWMNDFQASMQTFQPRTPAEEILHGEALHEFNMLVEARRLRLDAMLTQLSPVLWFIIIGGAVISLTSTFFFKVEDPALHRIQVLLLAGFMGMVITLIFAFDRPFHGDLAVDPGPYEFVKEQLMKN
jgi:hypothetical protein